MSEVKKKRKDITKDKGLYLRVTQSEKDEIVTKAKLANCSIAKLVLESLGRVRTWTIPNKKMESEKIREIRRIGNNLNQIAKWCNQHKSGADALQVLNQLVAIEKKTDELLKSDLDLKSFSLPTAPSLDLEEKE